MRRALAGLVLLFACVACARETPAPPAESPAAAVVAPKPSAGPEPGTEKGARDFVAAFMKARMARYERLVRTWLSPTALAQYDKGEGGLGLMETAASRFTGWDFVSVEAVDANSFEVMVEIREQPAGGKVKASFNETLFVGPGPDLKGQQRPWIIRGAMRSGG
ncbi:MAG TPA: hypothetical protein VG477_09875 [Thermoanaerobaculia bacterium]|nr:hypothetical protein [Thermoanaerobaculia bacterium]